MPAQTVVNVITRVNRQVRQGQLRIYVPPVQTDINLPLRAPAMPSAPPMPLPPFEHVAIELVNYRHIIKKPSALSSTPVPSAPPKHCVI
jgi:hypothetical protein